MEGGGWVVAWAGLRCVASVWPEVLDLLAQLGEVVFDFLAWAGHRRAKGAEAVAA